ncbi:MAG: hypothetical protein ACOC7R_03540, partial [Planctomycetota bacterium]
MAETGTQSSLRQRLERVGDPHDQFDWVTGGFDYVGALGVTADDVPHLLAIAREWAGPYAADEPEPQEDDVAWAAPIHAWRALAQLRAPETVGSLLGRMKALDEADDDWYLEEFPHVFAWIGPPAFDPVAAYLADDGHGLYPRTATAHGLTELAQRHGELRWRTIEAITEALSEDASADVELNGFLVAYLLDLHAVEAADVIERVFAADRVETWITGYWDDVRKALGVEGQGVVPEELAGPPKRRRRRGRRPDAFDEALDWIPDDIDEMAPPGPD